MFVSNPRPTVLALVPSTTPDVQLAIIWCADNQWIRNHEGWLIDEIRPLICQCRPQVSSAQRVPTRGWIQVDILCKRLERSWFGLRNTPEDPVRLQLLFCSSDDSKR